jgi:hypothetical protein
MSDVTRYRAVLDDDGYHNPSADVEFDSDGPLVMYEDYKALQSKLTEALEYVRACALGDELDKAELTAILERRDERGER